jgi:cyclophilin family peptidyl-prolyl cis-trans isomerase
MRCFLDIQIGGVDVGRLVITLAPATVPKTAENFRYSSDTITVTL